MHEHAQGTGSVWESLFSGLDWPSWSELLHVLALRDYNTRVVVLGVMMLGLAAGIIGTFMLLRKRSLMGDAISHATLPGIGIAFIIMVKMGGDGKFLPGLLIGAMISGVLGMLTILIIRRLTRLNEDCALGIVLSVFFGFGMVLLTVIQNMKEGNAAGLESFIYGKTASMLASDAMLTGVTALIVAVVCGLLFKEMALLCFDQNFAASQGWPVTVLDVTMMTLVAGVTVIGLQAVGLILIIALLIIPAAAARFWTDHLRSMVLVSGFIGMLAGYFGATLSALVPRLPAGAVIVLMASAAFGFSMVFGRTRGLLMRWLEHRSLGKRIGRQNLLRAMYERLERDAATDSAIRPGVASSVGHGSVTLPDLLAARSWSRAQLGRLLARGCNIGLVRRDSAGRYQFTEQGLSEARRFVRNHRLWELYLITHADIAPSRVDGDADEIEHVLGETMVDKLQALLDARESSAGMPPSPHPIARP
ncbi:MAG: manganese/zinc/iron transport system permease protein [Rhodothermales bacterium]|jgi:manganese/zinc/iron transport system permease protein